MKETPIKLMGRSAEHAANQGVSLKACLGTKDAQVLRVLLQRKASPMHLKSIFLKRGAVALLLSLVAACGESLEATGAGDATDPDGNATDPDGNPSVDGDSSADGDSSEVGATETGSSSSQGTASGGSSEGDSEADDPVPGSPVALGMAENYVILSKSGISTVPTSAITGNIGLSPAAAVFITGFSLTADATNVFSTSPQLVGKAYAADYASITSAQLTTAVSDMELAFTDAAGRAPDVTELGAGNIAGMTLTAGVYKWGSGLLISTDVTLSGDATDVWIFQVSQNLILSSSVRVLLAGGALSKNVFWQVAGLVDLGTTAHCEGVVLTQTSITLRTGASVNGRLLAQTAVALDSNAVVEPAD